MSSPVCVWCLPGLVWCGPWFGLIWLKAVALKVSFYLLLQFREQVQRIERGQPVEVHLAQPLQDGLRQRRKNGQLRRARRAGAASR